VICSLGDASGAFAGEAGVGRDVHLATDQRLDTRFFAFKIKLDCAEHITMVGNCHRRHVLRFGFGDQVFQADGAVQQRVLGMQVQMDKGG